MVWYLLQPSRCKRNGTIVEKMKRFSDKFYGQSNNKVMGSYLNPSDAKENNHHVTW